MLRFKLNHVGKRGPRESFFNPACNESLPTFHGTDQFRCTVFITFGKWQQACLWIHYEFHLPVRVNMEWFSNPQLSFNLEFGICSWMSWLLLDLENKIYFVGHESFQTWNNTLPIVEVGPTWTRNQPMKRYVTYVTFLHIGEYFDQIWKKGFRIESKNSVDILCLITISNVLNLLRWLLLTSLHLGPAHQFMCYSSCLSGDISDSHVPQHLGHANKKTKLCVARCFRVESTDHQCTCIFQTIWRWYKKHSCIITSACVWPPLNQLHYRNI